MPNRREIASRSSRDSTVDDETLTEALRALAHADRRRFVIACRGRSRTAGELADMTALAPASASEHLKVLRKCGLLELDVRGRFWLYRTNTVLLRRVGAAIARLGATPAEPGDE